MKRIDQSKCKCPFSIIDLNVTNGDNMFICLTCHGHLKKHSEPPQAAWNKLDIAPPPEILSNLNRLERVFISRRMLFKKVSIMSQGRFPKFKGSLCNIPIEIDDVVNVLLRGAKSNGLLVVTLKRKLSYRSHVYFEVVRPELIH